MHLTWKKIKRLDDAGGILSSIVPKFFEVQDFTFQDHSLKYYLLQIAQANKKSKDLRDTFNSQMEKHLDYEKNIENDDRHDKH